MVTVALLEEAVVVVVSAAVKTSRRRRGGSQKGVCAVHRWYVLRCERTRVKNDYTIGSDGESVSLRVSTQHPLL